MDNPVPDLNCKSAVLIDWKTGALLYSKNGEEEIPPASMTKLMTLHLVYNAIDSGRISRDEIVVIGKDADFRSLPPHSSLMFLQEGQRVSVLDLMKGLAVPSGNDAAIALADVTAGSVSAFVKLMNDEASRLGFKSMHFEDASGLSSGNRVTAADFAGFCAYYIRKHPEALKELHSLSSFTYPRRENIPPGGKAVYGPITQKNRNNLLGVFSWVDGLKTGYIDESGYNIALTADYGGRRLVAVLMGGPGRNAGEGSFIRAVDAVNILSYGFYRFAEYMPAADKLVSVAVYGGKKKRVKVVVPGAGPVTIPREAAYVAETVFELSGPVKAPVVKGDEIGKVKVLINGEKVAAYSVVAGEDVRRGSLFTRILDAVRLLFKKFPFVRKL